MTIPPLRVQTRPQQIQQSNHEDNILQYDLLYNTVLLFLLLTVIIDGKCIKSCGMATPKLFITESEVIQIDKENHVKKGAYCLTHIITCMSGRTKSQAKIQPGVKIGSRYHQKKAEGKKDNIFKMTPISNVYYKQTISVNFEPKKEVVKIDNQQDRSATKSSIDSAGSSMIEIFSITPRFNNDSKYYTPSFILPYDAQESDEEIKHCHDIKTKECIRQIDYHEILIPKPKSKNQFCAVCRQHYKDYLEHVKGFSHKQFIRTSKFNNDIEKMSHYFKETIKNNGVVTRAAKRKFSHLPYENYEHLFKRVKRENLQVKMDSKHAKEKQEMFGLEGLTPFYKRSVETTAKSIFSIYKFLD